MSYTKHNATYLQVGQVFSHEIDGWYARRVLKEVWMSPINDYMYVAERGYIDSRGDFKPGYHWSTSTTEGYMYLDTSKALLQRTPFLYEKDDYRSGDVLEDQYGNIYIFQSKDSVWNATKGTHSPLGAWDKDGYELKLKKSVSGRRFSDFIEVTAKN